MNMTQKVEENVIACEKEENVNKLVANLLLGHFYEDGNIIGYFEDADTFSQLTDVLRKRGYSYSIRDSTQVKKDDKNNTIFYNLKAMPIKFFGLPFTVEKTVHYQCINGRKYYKTKAERLPKETRSNALEKTRIGSSKKMGCLAHMTLKKIIFYPEYLLDDIKKWRIKRALIEKLRAKLNDEGAELARSVRYYVSISVKDRHNHPPFDPTVRPGRVPVTKTQSLPIEEANQQEIACQAPIISMIDEIEVEDTDAKFFHSLVKFPNQTSWEVAKPDDQAIASSSSRENEVTAYQIFQYTSLGDLQALFKEKLKRLYLLGEQCENPALLVKLVNDFEQADIELVNDIGYDPTI